MNTHPADLLTKDPEEMKVFILLDFATSSWVKDAIRKCSGRNPPDVLYELDVLLNLFEAVCDKLLGFTPNPHCRIRRIHDATTDEHRPL